jgi:hypothetical protein
VGRSRKGLNAFYQLEVYDSQGKQIAVKPLRHSLRYIYPYGPNSVLIVGIAATPNHSFYTIATKNGSQIETTAYEIPEEALADRWAGRPGENYFTDPGGFDDGSPIGTPLRTIFHFGTSGRPQYLQARIPGPAHSLYWNNALYVLVHPTVFSGGKGIARVDLQTEKVTQILSMAQANLSNMILLPDSQQLAVADEAGNQVVLVDLKTLATENIAVKAGSPRGLATEGHCLVVGSEKERQVSFIDRRGHHDQLAQWDLTPAGAAFMGLRDLAADSKSGRLYGRSAYPCEPFGRCPDARNSVILAEESSHETFNKCTLNF